MIIEFELQGSKELHKGICDTAGFWVRFEPQLEQVQRVPDVGMVLMENIVTGWKLFSHFSFCFYHEEKSVVDLVYSKLVSVLRGAMGAEIDGVGYIRRLNK